MITKKVFPEKIIFYRDGEPIYQFKVIPPAKQKKELRQMMFDEQSRRGVRDNFLKAQFDYNGTFRD